MGGEQEIAKLKISNPMRRCIYTRPTLDLRMSEMYRQNQKIVLEPRASAQSKTNIRRRVLRRVIHA